MLLLPAHHGEAMPIRRRKFNYIKSSCFRKNHRSPSVRCCFFPLYLAQYKYYRNCMRSQGETTRLLVPSLLLSKWRGKWNLGEPLPIENASNVCSKNNFEVQPAACRGGDGAPPRWSLSKSTKNEDKLPGEASFVLGRIFYFFLSEWCMHIRASWLMISHHFAVGVIKTSRRRRGSKQEQEAAQL